MSKENKDIVSFDEIVFENRNHDYGAYYLRKIYKKNTTLAVIIGMTVLLIVAGTPFIMASLNQDTKVFIDDTQEANLMKVDKQVEDEPPPPPPPPPPPALEQQVKFTAPVVVDSVEEKVELATSDQIVQTTNNNVVTDEVVEVTNNTVIETKDETAEVFLIVEEMPVFPGGDEELRKFIASNIKYPEIAKENGVQGKVYIYFVINAEGGVEQIEIKRSVDPYLDKEAIRVIQSMPKWTPGKQRGRPVKVAYTVPINFTLQ